MTTSVRPYPTLAGSVELEVVGAALDGRPQLLDMISRQERVVALHLNERSDWREARLELRARLPQRELSTGPWQKVECVAVLTEGVTNSRTLRPLRRASDGSWAGSITVERDLHRVRADLDLFVTATIGDVPGRIVGTDENPWIVDLTARTPLRQRTLEINEVDFGDADVPWLSRFKELPWLVETSGGDVPTVHLNLGFEGLKELLGSGGSVSEKALRGSIAAQIAAEAWTAMFHSAISELELDDDGTPQWPGGWRESVLRIMLPDVHPELPPADALFEAHSSRANGGGWHELQSRIQYAASRRAKVSRSLSTAIRSLDRSKEARA
ncbi:hypothetical protein [Streptomyces meridianus]|uniref:Uncharacterized protein n=1 Tax=Streptomyces meridianus TaxID=2938945 RepID=A0ABT0WZW7_9ACTN|nr:hypothetical protein [Streptomyces meridianus]MCM2575857.1 hypothetical protein [Streptomyces meridianus]